MSDFIVPDRSHLVAEYLLNGDARDTSGNGYHGSAADVQWTKTDRGYQTYSGEFNGSTSYVSSGDVLDFEKTDSFSIGYVGVVNSTSEANIVSKQMNSGSYTGYGLAIGSGDGIPRFFLYGGGEFGGSIIKRYPNAINDGKSHSLFATYDGSNSLAGIKLYLDGIIVDGVSVGTEYPIVGSLVTAADFQISGRGGTSIPLSGTGQSVRIFDAVLSKTEIHNWHLESLRALGGSTLAGLTDGTKHHFDFNGDANDIIGGFDGTAYSVSAVPDAVHGMAFSFNGTNAFVDASILPIPVNGDCTVYGWVKRNGTGNGTYNGMFNLQRGASIAGFGLFEGPGSTVYGFDGGVGVIDSTVTSSLGVWEFWGISRNSSGVKIYKNGSLVQTNVSARADGTSLNFLRVGTRENVTEFFNADMKLITVVNRELLPFEMLALYEISAKEKLLTFE